ncbi:MAG: methyltransferase domain-containing protein [Pirellulales bacterium]
MSEALTNQAGQDAGRPLNVEKAVHQRYAEAAREKEPALCCPVDYDQRYLEVLPAELIERDYGCGDPSKYLREGETVLDLGSGAGKICYIASQIVGPRGRVIGVDCNDEMLTLARKYQREIGDRIGHHNTEFLKGRIQDLQLDLDRLAVYLADHPVGSSTDWIRAEAQAESLRASHPLIADDSIDVVISNCVLNLVRRHDRQQLFSQIYRVLRRGGRAVISDIVSDEPVPAALQNDAEMWSGCISGAFVEHEFLEAFEAAGFYGVRIVSRQEGPWAAVEGIEFRSMTVEATKGKEGPCLDQNQAVIYRGPWKRVTDDDGHVLRRGVRTAVCGKTYAIYTRPPYRDEIVAVPPYEEISLDEAVGFDCHRSAVRSPRETKGSSRLTQLPDDGGCCDSGSCC